MFFMLTPKQDIFRTSLYLAIAATAFALALPAQAQGFSVIHTFSGGDAATSMARPSRAE